MSFMYLQLRTAKDGGILAEVRTDGGFSSLGSENSRNSNSPFAVFQIEEFVGIENVNTDDLLKEIQKRISPAEIRHRLRYEMTTEEILETLRERLK